MTWLLCSSPGLMMLVLVLVLVLVVIRMPMFFTRFDLVLVAVENRAYEDGQIHINPPHRRVATNNIGLFFARWGCRRW